MAKQRILIVDDSRTAQMRLRKMLDGYDVHIDTVTSAEEALAYLSYKQPALVFLDHHMKGMSGLAALKIIKSNPATALIPVVMYTSEQGDVYVGQARTLGAMDIISKDVVKASSVAALLDGISIVKSGAEELDTRAEAKGAISELESDDVLDVTNGSTDLEQVQSQVSRLFEIHMAKVQQEIEDSTKFITRRISRDIKAEAEEKESAKNASPDDITANQYYQSPVKESASGGTPVFLSILFTLALCFVGFHLYQNNEHYSDLVSKYEVLTTNYTQRHGQMITAIKKMAERPMTQVLPSSDRILFDALSWAVNVDAHTSFGEQALGDQRIYMLGELLSLLTAASFKGTIFLDIHAGNYCVVKGPSGQLLLPEPESNLDACVFLADLNPDLSLQSDISIGFLNYINSTPILNQGQIQLEMSSLGYSSPKYSYPATTNATSAGQWNEAARKNSRLAFAFSPD